MTVLALVTLLYAGFLWLQHSTSESNEDKTRTYLRELVADTGSRLRSSAADGTLTGTEIDRDMRAADTTFFDVRRQGRSVTVTVRIAVGGPGIWMGHTVATSCYRFRIVPPSVVTREVPEKNRLHLRPAS
jgi:hypothetical protein